MAIVIGCLSLFGLIILAAGSSTKEIGIRKINGAKVSEILYMLNKEFIYLGTLSFIIAALLIWLILRKWLQGFAFRTELSWWIFVLTGIIGLVIVSLTVSWQSWIAATRNPVEALRNE
jgi:putative ABC transport system permease protein